MILAAAQASAANDVAISPVFDAALRRNQASEARVRAAFVALDGVRQALGGLPQVLIDGYNAVAASTSAVLDRRLQEYASVGGDTSARTPLATISTRAKAVKYEAVTLGAPAAIAALRKVAAGIPGFVAADQLVVVTATAPEGASSNTRLLQTSPWEEAAAHNELALSGLHQVPLPVFPAGAGLGLPPLAIVAIVLGVGMVAAFVAEQIQQFHADTTKLRAAEAEARAVEAQATVLHARIGAYQKGLEQCIQAGSDPVACAQAAADAAAKVGELPTLPDRVAARIASMTLAEKLGVAVLAAAAGTAGYFGIKQWRRVQGLRTAY